MGKFKDIYIPTNNETHNLKFCKVTKNGWEFDENAISFKGRVASSLEQKRYNIMKGVVNNKNTIYIYASNLPEEIKPDDKVLFLGKEMTVTSVGYYIDQSKMIDASIFDPDYIKAISPKGITLD